MRRLFLAVFPALVSSSAYAAEAGRATRGEALAIFAIIALLFILAALLPFTRGGWLRRVCLGAFGLVSFLLFLAASIGVFIAALGKEGHYFIPALATAAMLAFLLIRWLNRRAARIYKVPQPAESLPEPKPLLAAAPGPVDKLASRRKLYIAASEFAAMVAVLTFACAGFTGLDDKKAYAEGARQSIILAALVMGFFAGGGWFWCRQKAKEILQLMPAVRWGASVEEAKGIAFSEVDGDTRGSRAAELAEEYLRQHQTEIEALERQFTELMTVKYGVAPDITAAMLQASENGRPIRAAAEWHRSGDSVEGLAALAVYPLRRYHAYDARIFPAAAHYNKTARRAMNAILSAVGLLGIAGVTMADSFIVSVGWRWAGFLFSQAAALAFFAWGCWLVRKGHILLRAEWQESRIGYAVIVLPFICILFWLGISMGFPALVTAVAGEPMRETFTMHKINTTRGSCVLLEQLNKKYCLKQEAFYRLPQSGEITLLFKKSWFGIKF